LDFVLAHVPSACWLLDGLTGFTTFCLHKNGLQLKKETMGVDHWFPMKIDENCIFLPSFALLALCFYVF